MKILVYGMQSSGASLIAFFLAQKPDTLAVIDFFSSCEAPCLDEARVKDIILKCVVTTKVPLETHLLNFKPDKKILVLRHPYSNYASLKGKFYGNDDGFIEDKLKALDAIFNKRDQFDLVIMYEDFLFDPLKVLKEVQEMGYGPAKDLFKFDRSKDEILNFNVDHSEWCKNSYLKKWGFGKIYFQIERRSPLRAFKYIRPEEKSKVSSLCPSLCRFYEGNFHWGFYKIYILILCLISELNAWLIKVILFKSE